MPANVETMFSVRETPWHGLGRIVMDAPASREALELAGLDWQVESRNIYSGTGAMIPGYRANVRSTDEAVLAWCLTATALCRTKKRSSSRMTCWVRGSPMKPQVPCRAARRSGCWQGFRGNILSLEIK